MAKKNPSQNAGRIHELLHQHRAPILAESIPSKESKLMKRHAIELRLVTTSFNCGYCKGEARIPAEQNQFAEAFSTGTR